MDAAVARDPALQEIVQGRRVLMWGPGYAATAAAQACVSFASICCVVGVLFLGPLDIAHLERMLVFGILPSGAVAVGLSQSVLRGWALGRAYIYRFSQALCLAALSAFIACLVSRDGTRQWLFASALSSLGVLFSLVGTRLIAGPGFALTSALFRARRAYAHRTSRRKT
jgi:hypothetical protein